jgi:predicted GIY-YIG superfamily endonuclease
MESNINNMVYIYGLYSSLDRDNVRYIGYTSNLNKRKNEHIQESKYLKYHRHKWIQNVLKNNGIIKMSIISCIDYDKKEEEEIKIIKLLREQGANLTNGNDGGRGGINPTKEVRNKLSLSKIGNTWNVGRKPSINNLNALKIANRKFNEQDIINIYKLYNEGYSGNYISKLYKSKRQTIYSILFGNSYNDIRIKYNLQILRTNKYNNERKNQTSSTIRTTVSI